MDEYSVPQMNGDAPNSPATGSQVEVLQKFRPNFWIESIDWRDSSKPIARTIRTSASANTPVPTRNPMSPPFLIQPTFFHWRWGPTPSAN